MGQLIVIASTASQAHAALGTSRGYTLITRPDDVRRLYGLEGNPCVLLGNLMPERDFTFFTREVKIKRLRMVTLNEATHILEAICEQIRMGDGDLVQRCNMPNGAPPAYRFRGTVCGTYTNPATGEDGYVVSSEHEPGCIQIFPAKMLELVAYHVADITTFNDDISHPAEESTQ